MPFDLPFGNLAAVAPQRLAHRTGRPRPGPEVARAPMPLPPLRALMAAVLMAALVVLIPASPSAAASTTTPLTFFNLPAADGVALKANLITPTTAGPHPAIVFISSWALNDAEYLAQATSLAAAGYVVLSYTSRGFWGSG